MRYQAGSYSTGRQGLDNVTMEKRNWDGSIQADSVPRAGTNHILHQQQAPVSTWLAAHSLVLVFPQIHTNPS